MGTRDAGRKDSAGPAVADPALRQRAEEQAQGMGVEDVGMLSPEAAQQLVHELRVQQIELEMQNEELRRMQEVLEASRARYFDLYDLAPVGYFTLSEQGLILEANLTATTMLGVPRGALVKQPLTRSIVPEDEDIYYLHHRRLLETGRPQVCELRMARQYSRVSQFWARLESIGKARAAVSALAIRDGVLWVGSAAELTVVEVQGGVVGRYSFGPDLPPGPRGETAIGDIAVVSATEAWVATPAGAIRLQVRH